MDLQAPLFKGATRTPCVFGVPIKAFVANIGLFSLLGLWVWVRVMIAAAVGIGHADLVEPVVEALRSHGAVGAVDSHVGDETAEQSGLVCRQSCTQRTSVLKNQNQLTKETKKQKGNWLKIGSSRSHSL